MKKSLLILFSILLFSGCDKEDDEDVTLPFELDFVGRVSGCGDFSIIKELDSSNPNITLSIAGTGRKELNITNAGTTFSLPDSDLICNINIHERSNANNFCNDVIEEIPELISQWQAVSGNITLFVYDVEETEFETYYKMQILLEDVVFEKNGSEERREISRLTIENIGLGFLPG
tara:strand:- start:561 stop:1085 length:525 start_codon:yes stop_codon:yes gene_type:complete